MGRLVKFKDGVYVKSHAAVGGRKESEGNLARYFDFTDQSDTFGKKTFEQSESEMQRLALNFALKKASVEPSELEAIYAGDLLNQCTGSSYGLAGFGAPFFGLFGACSTAAESLILGSMSISGGWYDTVACVVSSHNSSAERQFRFPLEYGSQRPPSAQWTTTASGAFILSSKPCGDFKITECMPGRMVNKGVSDQSDMGAAMAPAAASTIDAYFSESDMRPQDFDMILTGDLGYEGNAICAELLEGRGIKLGGNFDDCGKLIYDRKRQDTHSGGSGCGCSASVVAGYVAERFRRKEIKEVLLIGTGALMSPTSVLQGLNITGIGHLVRFSAV